ncbi:Cerevisin [Dactylella cylindrospora]|nr:Cerevisin [Dactylella cylindrospora]
MKSLAILSTSLLLAVLPHVFAAPTLSNAVNTRWVKGVESGPVAEPRAVIVDDSDDDPEDDYIVVLAQDETREWDEIFGEMGCNKSSVHTTFTVAGSRAFTMNMKKSTGVSMFSLPNVEYMEKNQKMHLAVMPRDDPIKKRNMGRDLLKGRKSRLATRQSGIWVEQSTAPWNLQRVSSADTVVRNGRAVTDLDYRYRFEQTSGAGVDVYVLDTGINVDHVDFGGRAQMLPAFNGQDVSDVEGHGTHTAGTVGSRTFGVAKNANIFGIKVFGNDGSGSLRDSVNAIEQVMDLHQQRRNNPGFRGSIISMSLGAPSPSPLMNSTIITATSLGIHFSVAAGNENQDACSTTPAGVSAFAPILTVGATDITDTRASFSNFGECTNIWGPGVAITSTFIGSSTAIDVLQGTSMSCPLVTGLMAVELSINPQFAVDPLGLKNHMLQLSLQNQIQDRLDLTPEVPKLLANNGFPGNPEN